MDKLKIVNKVIIHHTHRDPDSIDSIRNLHINKNGWEEIGYHYVIGNGNKTNVDGRIYETRSTKFMGAHVYGHNTDSIGIALIGNFDKTTPTKKQIESLTQLIIKIAKEHNIKIENIKGHREFPGVTKTCPGKNFDMNELREKLKTELSLASH